MSFIRLENEDVTINADSITSPAWGTESTLTAFFTSSYQTGSQPSGPYYWDIYSEDQGALAPSGSVQFSIAHASSGSSFTTASHAVWNQYATLLYGSDRNAATGSLTTDFYVINVSRTNYKESLSPSNVDLRTSNRTFTVEDTSTFDRVDAGRRYTLVDGANSGSFFADVGVIVLPTASLSAASDLETFYSQLNGSANFTLFSQETITSNFIFARVRNSQLNYSTNPSLVDNAGKITIAQLTDSPQAFPTTVGLYNDASELVAVAKLSRPLIKDFTKEALLRIKLDF